MDNELRELCRRTGLPGLSGSRVAVEAACKRIAELESAARGAVHLLRDGHVDAAIELIEQIGIFDSK